MRYLLTTLVLSLFMVFSSSGQNGANGFWLKIDETSIRLTGARQIIPNKYGTFKIISHELRNKLFTAPNERETRIDKSTCIVYLPKPDGSFERYRVVESSIMEESLAQAFPDIKTFSLRGIDDAYASGKLDWNEFGLHGMIMSPKGDFFIDPYCVGNTWDYISYYTSDFVKPLSQIIPEAGVINSEEKRKPAPASSGFKAAKTTSAICAGANLHTYRLAVACTGDYAIAATGLAAPTIAQTLAKVVTSVNRVDGVYEKEVSIRLVLVSTTTLVLYTVTATNTVITPAPSATAQPFTGNSVANTLIAESQNVITNVVGSSNFDIGHTFSTGGGGLAYGACVCNNSIKARGITGSANPVGDPYDIDFVAHEIGHQFGANHTFNALTDNCNNNRYATAAVEPGSGITIMGYAGICSVNNLADNSIPYFHAVSYDEIINFTNSTAGGACAVTLTTGNHPPVVTSQSSYLVPKYTPFYLTGSATDPDGDALTLSWEETDAGGVAGNNWNSGNKPFFRSYPPVTSGTRFFPIASVAASGDFTGTKGEYLPSSAQTLNFRLTARDNKMGGGGVCYASTSVVIDSSGPLMVTYPNVPLITWPILGHRTITWDVNGTDDAPVDCDSVRIWISYDSGNNYSVLVTSTPNDGAELIPVPTVTAIITTCRIKVESRGNVFYDVGNNDFTISTDPGAGIAEASQNNLEGLNVWPNPFNNEINFSINNLNSQGSTEIRVVDLLGKVLFKSTYSKRVELNESIDVSNLSRGVYFIMVINAHKQAVYRVVKD